MPIIQKLINSYFPTFFYEKGFQKSVSAEYSAFCIDE